MANDAETLALNFAKGATEQTAQAMALLVVQQGTTRDLAKLVRYY